MSALGELVLCLALPVTWARHQRRHQARIFTRRRMEQLRAGPQPDAVRPRIALRGTGFGALTAGGRARHAVAATRAVGAHDASLLAFDQHAARLAHHWTWLDVDAPFRLQLPVTVLALRVDRVWPHIIVKRAGPADVIARRRVESHRSWREDPSVVFERIDLRFSEHAAIAVAPPATLGRASLANDAPRGWRAWGPPVVDDHVRRLAAALLGDGRFLADRELVIEVLGSRLIAYTASGPTLSYETLEEFDAAIVTACERALAATPVLSARGVEG